MEFAKFSVAGKSFYAQTEEELHKVRKIVQEIDPEGSIYEKVMMYNTSMISERIDKHHDEYNMRILFNASPRGSFVIDENVKQYENNSLPLLKGLAMRSMKDVELDGQVIAQYDITFSVLYILFDLVGQDGWIEYFERIIKELKAKVLGEIKNTNDWSNKDAQESLVKRVAGNLTDRKERELRELRSNVSRGRGRALEYEQEILNQYAQIKLNMEKIDVLEKQDYDPQDKYIKEFDLIVADSKVESMTVLRDGSISIKTVPLTINASGGTQHVGGSFTFSFKVGNTSVKIDSDVKKKSYWTSRDPHPHVDGSNGHACWGSVSTTLGQLMSQEEFYAYVSVIISFLESANEGDVAGRHVHNWDLIKSDGSVVPAEEGAEVEVEDEEEFFCTHCQSSHRGDGQVAYDYVDSDGDVSDEQYICDRCRREDYHYDEDLEEYIHDNNEGWNH